MPASSDTTASLLLTALNSRDSKKARTATRILGERDTAVVPLFRAAMALGLSPRRTEAIEDLDDPALRRVVLSRKPEAPWSVPDAPYADLHEEFRKARSLSTADVLAHRMILADPERARRELPTLMLQTHHPVLAWTQLDNDESLVQAEAYLRASLAEGLDSHGVYLDLSGQHPAIARRDEVDGVFRRAGLPLPTLGPGDEFILRGLFRTNPSPTPFPVPRVRSHRTVGELERAARSVHERIRIDALAELSWRDPRRAGAILGPMLRSGSGQGILLACRVQPKDAAGLLAAAGHPDRIVRQAVAEALRLLPGTAAKRGLGVLRQDPAWQVRVAAGAIRGEPRRE